MISSRVQQPALVTRSWRPAAVNMCITVAVAAFGMGTLSAQEPVRSGSQPDQVYSPPIAPASNEGQLAIQRMQVPDGLKLELVASEPMLANPVSFSIDERGRFYVAETFRINAGVTDNRDHMVWLDDDLASRTVDDRVAMYRKFLGKEIG